MSRLPLLCADPTAGGRPLRAALLVLLLAAAPAVATETGWWTIDTVEEMLKGRGDGVAVTDDGRLVAVPRWVTRAGLEEPVVLAGAVAGDGSAIVATGHPARLYRVKGGSVELLTDLPGEQATAVLVGGDGSILVATATPGVLSRFHDGALEEVGRLGEGGIWDLAELEGTVVAAAGPPASLYRLTAKGLERWAELPDVHARCLAASGDALVVGTSGKGLILRVGPAGQVAILAESPFREIADVLVVPDGSVWATAVVGEPQRPSGGSAGGTAATGEAASATVQTGTIPLDLPKVDGGTATSEVMRLTPEGALLEVHRFPKQVASSLAWDGTGVLVGTGFEGELWRFLNSGGARLASVDATQVTAILGGGAVLLTQGPGGVVWRAETSTGCRYRSEAKHFPRPVRFGDCRLQPPLPGLRIRFRSGIADKPDDTWLPWSEWLEGGVAVPLPPASALQWEVELPAAESTGLERVEVAYREVNLAPELKEVAVEEPGLVYLSGPPPSGPIVGSNEPSEGGLFTVLEEDHGEERKPRQGKKSWEAGLQTVSWKGEDPNGDPLRYSLELERRNGFRFLVRERLETTEVTIDTSAVPDGLYRFLVNASDEVANPGAGLAASTASTWFVIDNTPPVITFKRGATAWTIAVADSESPLARVEWSRDGDRWHQLLPADGVLDGLRESFTLEAAPGRHVVVVRAIDRNHNAAAAAGLEG